MTRHRIFRRAGSMHIASRGVPREAFIEALDAIIASLDTDGPEPFVSPRDWTYSMPLPLTRESDAPAKRQRFENQITTVYDGPNQAPDNS